MQNTNARKFLKYDGKSSPAEVAQCHSEYERYLEVHQLDFPANAFAFANAPWHYDPTDSRCPHDSRLVSLTIHEVDNQMNANGVQINARLLGAYQDGEINIVWRDVSGYRFVFPNNVFESSRHSSQTLLKATHGDWLIDEVFLSSQGKLVHLIEFSNNVHWRITCADIRFDWNPVGA